ncbi:hypothetical protein KY326_04965 [Candidatus Woesearchaeota archaeon]|nr:hypothetical protein [Candidatus Woesearchaeota archaeon]
MKNRLDYKFCKKCEEKIRHRIKVLSGMELDQDREFVIQQLYFLLDEDYEPRCAI